MMKNFLPHLSLAFFASCLATPGFAQTLDEVVVHAEKLATTENRHVGSLSVIDHRHIEQRNARHLEDILALAANVNFASGASRGRFIQIRGIGERSEFQQPVNYSVGVLVDGIDFTGIAGAAAALDTRQIEILRGPQGTLFGANALAGLVNIVSASPDTQRSGMLGVALEDFDGLEFELTLNQPLSDRTALRIAAKHYASDGYIDNSHLSRDDTNRIEESSARIRIRSQLSQDDLVDLIFYMVDIDNGYDAFSLDNNRQTFSDEPGKDSQKTIATAISWQHHFSNSTSMDLHLSHLDADLLYSYDEDWSHPQICQGTICDSDLFGFDWFYQSVDRYQRDHQNTVIDLKIQQQKESMDWFLGLYYRHQKVSLERDYSFNSDVFNSLLNTDNAAIYGEMRLHFTDSWFVRAGARVERRQIDYMDNNNASANPDESLWGGKIGIEYAADDHSLYYGLISRGYKAGGFNLDAEIDREQRQYETESMLNYELGWKKSWLEGRMQTALSVFYQDRNDIQSKQSRVMSIANGDVGGECPCRFIDFTANAAEGENYGLEFELKWHHPNGHQLFANLGLLETRFKNYSSFEHVDADRDNAVAFDLSGREQAHAPQYQWILGGEIQLAPQWALHLSLEAKDGFYFSDRHEERADSIRLANAQIKYSSEQWSASIYAKNLSNEHVQTRGFGSFGNDPRNFYAVEPYYQFAAPRVVGVKFTAEF